MSHPKKYVSNSNESERLKMKNERKLNKEPKQEQLLRFERDFKGDQKTKVGAMSCIPNSTGPYRAQGMALTECPLSAFLLHCLLALLLACLLACLPACFLACLFSCLLDCLLTCLLSCLLARFLTCLLASLPVC